jgi:thioesterase domain-containing protein
VIDVMRDPALAEDAAATAPVLGFHLDGTRIPLIAIRTWFDEVPSYTRLARRLGADQPILTIAPPRGERREDMPSTAEAWAERCRVQLAAIGAGGPYVLGGWSFGGVVALELARMLAAAGADVRRVVMIDTWLPGHRTTNRSFARRMLFHVNRLAELDPPARWPYVRGRIAKEVRRWRRRATGRRGAARADAKDAYGVDHIVTERGSTMSLLKRTIWVAHYKYHCTPTALPVSIYASDGSREARGEISLGWLPRLRGDCEIVAIPGHHFSVFEEPQVAVLAARIRRTLDAAVGVARDVDNTGDRSVRTGAEGTS